MVGFSDSLENQILKHRFSILKCATCFMFVGLSSQDPLDDASGLSEPAQAGSLYARVRTTHTTGTSWQVADATGVTIDNAVIITFPTAGNVWGTMTHFAIFSGGTAGASVLCSGQLTASKLVESGDTARFAAGALDICLK